ncbi:hypothetical protein EMIT043CA1_50304 [Pseudomonas brassicacearum]
MDRRPATTVKKAPLSGLPQNLRSGQQGSAQHDGTAIDWIDTTVLVAQSQRSHPTLLQRSLISV